MAEKKSKAPLHGKENVKRRGAKSAADASSGQRSIKPPTYPGWEEYAADERRKADDATVAARKRTVGIAIAAASAIASLCCHRRFSTSQGRTNNAEARGTAIRDKDQTPKEAFLRWFVDNGGIYHPIGLGGDGDATTNVTIEEFPSYGGWGLALAIPGGVASSSSSDPPPGECRSDDVHGQCEAAESPPVIRRLDPLFTVPSSIIITAQSVIETYSSHASPLHLPDFRRAVNGILNRSFPNGPGLSSRGMGLGQQDAIIAAYLMAEDCQHRHPDLFDVGDGGGTSFWGGYLDVLPGGVIPRLDTFGDEDYAALRDEVLERAGRESLRLLRKMFGGDEAGDGDGDGGGLRTVVRDMIRRKIGMSSSSSTTTTTTKRTLPHVTTTIVPDSCISFEAFHRFVGIVSSRAMVLRGVKQ